RASSASRTSCCGRRPTASSTSWRRSAPTCARWTSCARSAPTPTGTGASDSSGLRAAPTPQGDPVTLTVDEYASRFHEEPGFLDFAAFGPVGDTVVAEQNALTALLTASRHGALAHFLEQEERVKQAVAGVTGF